MKIVERSDGLWRFACGDVFLYALSVCVKILVVRACECVHACMRYKFALVCIFTCCISSETSSCVSSCLAVFALSEPYHPVMRASSAPPATGLRFRNHIASNHVIQTWALTKVSMFPLCICAHLCMIVFMCTFGVNLILSTYRMFKVLLAIILSIMCLSVFVCAHMSLINTDVFVFVCAHMSLINTNVFVFVHLWSRISHASWVTAVTQMISCSHLPRHKSLT